MPTEKNTTETRQAEPSKTNYRTLIWSTALGAIALAAVLIWFFVYR